MAKSDTRREFWVFKGSSNFCQTLELDPHNLDGPEVKSIPDGFYDIVSTADTVEGGIHVREVLPGSDPVGPPLRVSRTADVDCPGGVEMPPFKPKGSQEYSDEEKIKKFDELHLFALEAFEYFLFYKNSLGHQKDHAFEMLMDLLGDKVWNELKGHDESNADT